MVLRKITKNKKPHYKIINMKKYFFIIYLLIINFSIFSENVNFSLRGLETVSKDSIILPFNWDESFFGKETSKKYNHYIARIASIFSMVSYVDVLNNPKENELIKCYNAIGIKNNDIELHYNINYKHNLWGNDQTAFSFATKKIQSSKGERNLIFVVIRGTPLSANEWISNFNISNKTHKEAEFHEGFYTAAKQIESAFISYLLKNKIDIQDCYLLITGHSRGAAVANILASELLYTELFDTNNIYAYTFATPNVTTNKNASDSNYNYIWNIVNAEDIVPNVPMNRNQWKYRKFGNTKVIINSWNSNLDKYNNDYLPKMNQIFRKFLLRDYVPFKTGPFIPIQISSFSTSVSKNIETFYDGLFSFYDKAVDLSWEVFPEEKNITKKESSFIENILESWLKKQFNITTEDVKKALIDMHAMETYFSWIFSTDDKTLYSNLGMSQIKFDGCGDYAIFDDSGNKIATILNGTINYSQIKKPIAAVQFISNTIFVGLPANQDFYIIASKESIVSTFLSAQIQHFSAEGLFENEFNKVKLYPHLGKLYKFKAGTKTFLESEISLKKITGKNAKTLRKESDLRQSITFNVVKEIFGTSDGSLGAGLHLGNKYIYGSILFSHNFSKIGRSLEISPGLGTQQFFSGPILLNTEIYSKLFWAFSEEISNNENKFNIVPAIRFSLSFKPKKRFQVFAATTLEFCIQNFNTAAFDSDYRTNTISQIHTNSDVKVVPNFQFGVKF